MIVVDSSVLIDYFCGNENPQVNCLDELLGVKPVAVGDLILAEVLQGFKSDKDFRVAKQLFKDITVFDMLGESRAVKCAENLRYLRARGITIRKTTDVVIASFCIEQRLPLLFIDRDFRPFVDHLGLIEA